MGETEKLVAVTSIAIGAAELAPTIGIERPSEGHPLAAAAVENRAAGKLEIRDTPSIAQRAKHCDTRFCGIGGRVPLGKEGELAGHENLPRYGSLDAVVAFIERRLGQ